MPLFLFYKSLSTILIYIVLYVLIFLHFAIHSDIIILTLFKGSLKNAVAAAVGAH